VAWYDGEVLNAATRQGSNRAGLHRFRTEALGTVCGAVTAIRDAHRAVAAAGFVAVDLYDGSFLWDGATGTMRLIDLDEYRPGPFTVPGERLRAP
jgi:serine/threonine-protein kinase